MGIRVEVKRSDFYNELSLDKQHEYLGLTRDKYLPAIDNIYYGVYLQDDSKHNYRLENLLESLSEFKRVALDEHLMQEYCDGLYVDWQGISFYKYCLTNPDLYDIFVASNLSNDEMPRVHVQLRAYGLWLYGSEKMICDSYNHVVSIFSRFADSAVKSCRENRVDYCYHTNSVQRPETIFRDRQLDTYLCTAMSKYKKEGRLRHERGHVIHENDYYALGSRTSNYVFVRFYNKGLEVIDEGYKGFFFNIWRQKGLISNYDYYCLDRAYKERNFDYIHKARLEYYIENGPDDRVKREFELTLADKSFGYKEVKAVADSYMPHVTTVFNIEFETKRKFYYRSDDYIDEILRVMPSRIDIPEPLHRVFKIIDNRKLFLEYLTRRIVSFRLSPDVYASWWARLRSTKVGGNPIDDKLVRDYSSRLDRYLIQRKFVNTVSSSAAYSERLDTSFVSDLSDILSNMNDNHAHNIRLMLLNEDDLSSMALFSSELLSKYEDKKADKYTRIKNRILKEDKPEGGY